MEIKKLKEFIKFMDDNNLNELEIEEDGKRIRLKKNSSSQPTVISQAPLPVPTAAPAENKPADSNTLEIKSPMVGTFYTAPSPGAKPYAEIGTILKPGDIVCIIEAMKLMNEIKAEVGGKVVQILAENGNSIEFGQTLFAIEPV
ncbi:MAG: acetyl-CoA carboxylase biotin carboxyl carrier protein [Candidatus Omnitrophica bacterium]|nr:acetyl-CoA carboxylase biotin carboxyl carrier protein [Candidatus Omnitrophota bacterium]